MTSRASPEPHPSATVIPLRDGPGGLEVLLLRRSSRLSFHGGAWVFPGGRIDPADRRQAPADDPAAAARYAAVREAREEAGLEVAAGDLVCFARWTTPEGLPKRFVTAYFAAVVDQARVEVDGGEICDHRWMSPADALGEQAVGRMELPPPTFVTLTALLPFDTARRAYTELDRREPEVFTPRLHRVDGGTCTLYQADAGYESGDLDAVAPRHRLWMLDTGWRYERSIGER